MRTSLSFSGFGPLTATLQAVDAARAGGWDGVWMCEHLGFTDGVVPAAAALARTSGIEVGIVGPAPVARHPGLFAMELASLATIAPGRVRVQVGLGDARLVRPLGGDHRRGLQVAREFVGVLADLLAGNPVHGEFAGHRFDGVRIVPPPVPPRIDLMAVRPRMLALATEVADGVSLTAGASPGYLASTVTTVGKALAAAGRDRAEFRISATVLGAVARDEDTAAAMLRPVLEAFAPSGFAVTAPEVFDPAALAAAESGERPWRDLLTTEAIKEIALVATPDTVDDALARLAATGVDEVALGLVNPPDEVPAVVAGFRGDPAR